MTASLSMMTKGGLETITRHLAMEYATAGIRFNTVAPGVVYTPMQARYPPGNDGEPLANGAAFNGD